MNKYECVATVAAAVGPLSKREQDLIKLAWIVTMKSVSDKVLSDIMAK